MLKTLAQVISFVFHPLLIVTYMLILLLLVNPYLFGVNHIGDGQSVLLIIRTFFSSFLIPAVAVVVMRFLGLVQSLDLKERTDRIGPYIITGVFYSWLFINFFNSPKIPTAFASFVLGATIGLFLAFFINIFSKISAHAVGMGGLAGMVIITMMLFSYDTFIVESALIGSVEISMNTLVVLAVILAGLVGTCRLALEAHEPRDLYGGYLVGFATQFIALRIIF